MKKYSGIGSRLSPNSVLKQMSSIAEHLANQKWLLRSGGADGADLAFEQGCDKVNGSKEIFLPWLGFNKSTSKLYPPTEDAYILAQTIHPAWSKLTLGAMKLHARNMHQILGVSLNDPVELVICWTLNGQEKGGTATAIRLAKKFNIKIINLAIDEFDFNSY